MKTPIVPLVFLVTFSGVLIWRAGSDEQQFSHSPAFALASPARAQSVAGRGNGAPSPEGALAGNGAGADPWPNTEVVNQLRDVDANAASVRAAIAHAQPVLATDQNVQLLVGDLLVGHGDPINGLAWQLLACEHCTQVDERIGYGCAAEGLCDPNLAYVDVLKRDFGEPAVAEALARVWEIRAAIADHGSLASFTEIVDARFPREDEQ